MVFTHGTVTASCWDAPLGIVIGHVGARHDAIDTIGHGVGITRRYRIDRGQEVQSDREDQAWHTDQNGEDEEHPASDTGVLPAWSTTDRAGTCLRADVFATVRIRRESHSILLVLYKLLRQIIAFGLQTP